MEQITLGQIGASITLLTIIVGFFVTIYKFYKANFTDKMKKFEERLDILEEKTKNQDGDIQDSKKERKILLEGVLASLKGLQQMGCNHEVTTGIKTIEGYLMDKSHD